MIKKNIKRLILGDGIIEPGVECFYQGRTISKSNTMDFPVLVLNHHNKIMSFKKVIVLDKKGMYYLTPNPIFFFGGLINVTNFKHKMVKTE